MPVKKVFLAHNSCLNSSYDFNLIKAGLETSNFEIVGHFKEADEIIFSGCAVRDLWVTDAINQIEFMHGETPSAQITVTGCVANTSVEQMERLTKVRNLAFKSHAKILEEYTGLNLQTIDRAISQNHTQNYEGDASNGLANLRKRVGPEKAALVGLLQEIDREFDTELESYYRKTTKGFVFYNQEEEGEFVTVTRSCPYKCTFCNIPKGRGEFTSVSLEDILKKVNMALARGVKHFTLVGDEIGNYGAGKLGAKFPDMILAILNLSTEITLSIRYIEPKPLMRNFSLLSRLCKEGKIQLLYVSLQSGSQKVLDRMGRNYNITKVIDSYEKLRQETETVFYCNWMVGFPGETEEEFQETINLVKHLNLHINIAIPFSPRPDTPAENFQDQIDEEIKADRIDRLNLVIADLKADSFRSRIDFLEVARANTLLDQIRLAELVTYEDTLQKNKTIKIHSA